MRSRRISTRPLFVAGCTVIVFFALFLHAPGCGRDAADEARPRPAAPAERLVLIGLDAANWEILRPLLDAGRLPFLAGLIDSGASAILWSREPTSTPEVWTTILTGRETDAHGIAGFTARDERTGEVVPAQSWMRRVPALWDHLNFFGRTAGVVGAHVTWPAEPIDGFVVSRLVWQHSPRATHPEALAQDLPKVEWPELDAVLGHPQIPSLNHEVMQRLWDEDNAAFEVGLQAARRIPTDFLFVYYHFTDIVQHNLWPEGEAPRGGALEHFEPIFRVYEHVDRRLGALLEQVGNEKTAVVVVSDHGAEGTVHFLLFERHPQRLLEALGLLSFRDEDGERVIDRAASKVLPGPESANVVHFVLNLEHAELAGDPKARDQHAKSLVRALSALRLRPSNRPLFSQVKIDRNHPEQVVARLALNVGNENDELLIQGRAYPVSEFYRPLPLGGGHTVRGVVIASGPPFRHGASLVPADPERLTGPPADALRVVDVAPTVLAALGLPVPDDLEGRAMESLFAPEFLAGRTLDPQPVALDWQPPAPPVGLGEPPPAIVDALRALGYVR